MEKTFEIQHSCVSNKDPLLFAKILSECFFKIGVQLHGKTVSEFLTLLRHLSARKKEVNTFFTTRTQTTSVH